MYLFPVLENDTNHPRNVSLIPNCWNPGGNCVLFRVGRLIYVLHPLFNPRRPVVLTGESSPGRLGGCSAGRTRSSFDSCGATAAPGPGAPLVRHSQGCARAKGLRDGPRGRGKAARGSLLPGATCEQLSVVVACQMSLQKNCIWSTVTANNITGKCIDAVKELAEQWENWLIQWKALIVVAKAALLSAFKTMGTQAAPAFGMGGQQTSSFGLSSFPVSSSSSTSASSFSFKTSSSLVSSSPIKQLPQLGALGLPASQALAVLLL
ncbi:PREDICTED: uncharacterized protein LOC108445947 [Corvus brachyrhynchos]|uniref:uncharacterized protein LOC108445947 n=1 Tax=Corvus brachyrhynchos TaxID=85066 RepID=UPI0008164972|nr:PREDICTED: uncharacterized protein LOC108445947 [Corvus brachyrhynchos]